VLQLGCSRPALGQRRRRWASWWCSAGQPAGHAEKTAVHAQRTCPPACTWKLGCQRALMLLWTAASMEATAVIEQGVKSSMCQPIVCQGGGCSMQSQALPRGTISRPTDCGCLCLVLLCVQALVSSDRQCYREFIEVRASSCLPRTTMLHCAAQQYSPSSVDVWQQQLYWRLCRKLYRVWHYSFT
jgi:hypothetical protein